MTTLIGAVLWFRWCHLRKIKSHIQSLARFWGFFVPDHPASRCERFLSCAIYCHISIHPLDVVLKAYLLAFHSLQHYFCVLPCTFLSNCCMGGFATSCCTCSALCCAAFLGVWACWPLVLTKGWLTCAHQGLVNTWGLVWCLISSYFSWFLLWVQPHWDFILHCHLQNTLFLSNMPRLLTHSLPQGVPVFLFRLFSFFHGDTFLWEAKLSCCLFFYPGLEKKHLSGCSLLTWICTASHQVPHFKLDE